MTMFGRVSFFIATVGCLFPLFLVVVGLSKQNDRSMSQPNIVFIFTDDQDVHLNSLDYMPLLKQYLTDQGTSFSNHYCTVSLCCPSRASLWTGKAAHNTNVTDLAPPYGGYPIFVQNGFNDDYFPLWMQSAGYNTYYVGKLFNSLAVTNYDAPFVKGWTGSDFLLDPHTYDYYNVTMQRNQDPPISCDGQYSTDIIGDKGLAFLNDALAADKPFFLTIAPTAPHSRVDSSGGQHPPVPAVRHAGLFNDSIVPRTANFNPDVSSGASWIATLPQQNQTNVDYNDDWYRNRLRTLQAVDEIIPTLLDRLTEAGILENTYVFYSTDNGYSIGQHRRQPGKQCAYQEDINIPLIVRGPGVPAGFSSEFVTSHLDLAPTFLALAGVGGEDALQTYKLDGSAIPLDADTLLAGPQQGTQEHVNAEMWGIIVSEGMYGMVEYVNHTYKALRVIGDEYSVMYNAWCVGNHELYDLVADPYEMDNLSLRDKATEITLSGSAAESTVTTTIGSLLDRLDALLLVQKSCAGDDCRQPWEALHPAGDVQSLKDALASQYDDFYSDLPKVAWDQCDRGYIKEMEGVMWDERLAFDQSFMQNEVWTGL